MKIFQLFSILLILTGLIYFFKQRDNSSSSEETSTHSPKTTRTVNKLSESEKKDKKAQEIEENIETEWRKQNFDAVNDSFQDWIEFNPEGAFSYIGRIQYPLEPLQFSSEIKAYLETLPPAQAMTESLKLSNNDLQESVTSDLFAQWLEDDFESSQTWLLQHSEQPFIPALAERMGRLGNLGDPKEALEWIINVQEKELRSKLVKGVVLRWLRVDQDTAIQHLNSLPASSAFDEAATDYATELSEEKPVAAMMWANTIESEDLRTMVVNQIKWGWNEDLEKEYQELLKENE